MLPISSPPYSDAAARHIHHPAFGALSFGMQSPGQEVKSRPPFHAPVPMGLPYLSSPPHTQGSRHKQQQQQQQHQTKQQSSQRHISTPTMSALRQSANAEVLLCPSITNQIYQFPLQLSCASLGFALMICFPGQHLRAYGLTDDVDEGDGHDLSLSRSDQRPQARAVLKPRNCYANCYAE